MTDLRNHSRQFILDFITLYRSYPCLWKIKSKEFSDRDLKNKAYDEMIAKLKEVDPTATRDSVKKKIDSLRGCFRKELKKVYASKKSGTGADDVYTPRLWYYDYLLFLTDQETPRESVTNIEEDVFSPDVDQSLSSETFLQSPASMALSEDAVDIETPQSSSSCNNNLSSISSTPVRSNKSGSKRTKVDKADEVLDIVRQKLESTEDKFDVIGKSVAHKLRELPKDVSVIADKFISDILFDAALGNITRHSKMHIADGKHQESQFTSVWQMNSALSNTQGHFSQSGGGFNSQTYQNYRQSSLATRNRVQESELTQTQSETCSQGYPDASTFYSEYSPNN